MSRPRCCAPTTFGVAAFLSIASAIVAGFGQTATSDDTRLRASIEPANPEAFYTIATYYWDKAFRDLKLSTASRQGMAAKGLESVERALQLRPDYVEALVYKGLLLRLQANLDPDPRRRDELIREAEELRDRAQRLRENKRERPRQRMP